VPLRKLKFSLVPDYGWNLPCVLCGKAFKPGEKFHKNNPSHFVCLHKAPTGKLTGYIDGMTVPGFRAGDPECLAGKYMPLHTLSDIIGVPGAHLELAVELHLQKKLRLAVCELLAEPGEYEVYFRSEIGAHEHIKRISLDLLAWSASDALGGVLFHRYPSANKAGLS
jgi:hypothetical protein